MWARIGFRHSECVDSLVGQGQGQDEGEGRVKDEGRWLGHITPPQKHVFSTNMFLIHVNNMYL